MVLKKVILDVLIPLEVSLVDLVEDLSNIKGVELADVDIKEIERKVETSSITIEGKGFDFDEVKRVLENTGASIHNIDRITSGRK